MRSGKASDDDRLIPVSSRLAADELVEVDNIAAKEERKRSDVIRRLVREALAARGTTKQ
jgi:metal-responsive CopG/Arc/MetJ family transcriptional regulator